MLPPVTMLIWPPFSPPTADISLVMTFPGTRMEIVPPFPRFSAVAFAKKLLPVAFKLPVPPSISIVISPTLPPLWESANKSPPTLISPPAEKIDRFPPSPIRENAIAPIVSTRPPGSLILNVTSPAFPTPREKESKLFETKIFPLAVVRVILPPVPNSEKACNPSMLMLPPPWRTVKVISPAVPPPPENENKSAVVILPDWVMSAISPPSPAWESEPKSPVTMLILPVPLISSKILPPDPVPSESVRM